jgi:hypothetical protein
MRKMHKKAGLELSINAIVIVILAMTLLGLGLGFINGMFGNITSLTDSKFSQIAEDLNGRLSTSNEDILFSKTQTTIPRGSNSLEGLGVKNDEDRVIKFGIIFKTEDCPDTSKVDGICPETKGWFTYLKGDGKYTVKAADSSTSKTTIQIPRTAKTGLYLISIIVYEGVWNQENCADDYDPQTGVGCSVLGKTELFLTVS